MKLNDAQARLERGDKLMVTVASGMMVRARFAFPDGEEVSVGQFEKLRENLVPCDPPLLPDCLPTSFEWRGE